MFFKTYFQVFVYILVIVYAIQMFSGFGQAEGAQTSGNSYPSCIERSRRKYLHDADPQYIQNHVCKPDCEGITADVSYLKKVIIKDMIIGCVPKQVANNPNKKTFLRDGKKTIKCTNDNSSVIFSYPVVKRNKRKHLVARERDVVVGCRI